MMSTKKLYLPLLLLLLCCLGVAGVEALPTCQKIVKTYRTIRTRNKVSPLVAAKWAIWNKEHPDFVAHDRPKYKYTQKEIVDKVDFACPSLPPIVDTEVALEPLPPVEDEFPEEPLMGPPSLYHVPDVVNVASNGTPALPFVPPYNAVAPPTVAADVPEPSNLLLLATGSGALLLLGFRRRGTWTAAAPR